MGILLKKNCISFFFFIGKDVTQFFNMNSFSCQMPRGFLSKKNYDTVCTIIWTWESKKKKMSYPKKILPEKKIFSQWNILKIGIEEI